MATESSHWPDLESEIKSGIFPEKNCIAHPMLSLVRFKSENKSGVFPEKMQWQPTTLIGQI